MLTTVVVRSPTGSAQFHFPCGTPASTPLIVRNKAVTRVDLIDWLSFYRHEGDWVSHCLEQGIELSELRWSSPTGWLPGNIERRRAQTLLLRLPSDWPAVLGFQAAMSHQPPCPGQREQQHLALTSDAEAAVPQVFAIHRKSAARQVSVAFNAPTMIAARAFAATLNSLMPASRSTRQPMTEVPSLV